MSSAYPSSIILGSRSPRRQALLSQIDVRFELLDFEINETVLANEEPLSYVQRMASEKALTGWQLYQNQSKSQLSKALLAADTCVVLGDKVLGKPGGIEQAESMLGLLSGAEHRVITCVALKNDKELAFLTSKTRVKFATLSTKQIKEYCRAGEGLDKAGGYAIQGVAAKFVESINGSYSGVVGLPLYETCVLLDKHFKDNNL